ncbi:MAG: hypothetical protein Q9164_003351 [Protoblastenia rupestris]
MSETKELTYSDVASHNTKKPGDPEPKSQPPASSTTTSGKSETSGMGIGLYAIILVGALAAFGAYKYLQTNSESGK